MAWGWLPDVSMRGLLWSMGANTGWGGQGERRSDGLPPEDPCTALRCPCHSPPVARSRPPQPADAMGSLLPRTAVPCYRSYQSQHRRRSLGDEHRGPSTLSSSPQHQPPPQVPARGSGPWAASWRAGRGTAAACKGCRRSTAWQPPGAGRRRQRPASSEGLRLAGVGPSAGGAGRLACEGKRTELQLHLPGRDQAALLTSSASSAHLLLPGICPAVQAQSWIQGTGTSEGPRDENTDQAEQLSSQRTRTGRTWSSAAQPSLVARGGPAPALTWTAGPIWI